MNPQIRTIETSFPYNARIMADLKKADNHLKCSHSENDRIIVCLDPKCKNDELRFCEECRVDFHEKCQENLILKISDLFSRMNYSNLKFVNRLPKKELKAHIKSEIDKLYKMLDETIDSFDNLIDEGNDLLKKIYKSPFNIILNKKKFRFEVDENSSKIFPKSIIQDSLIDISNSVYGELKFEFFRKIKNLQTELMVKNFKSIINLNFPRFESHKKNMQKLSEANLSYVSHIMLDGWDTGDFFTIENYLKETMKKMSFENCGFKTILKNSKSLEIQEGYGALINKAFFQSKGTVDAVYEYLQKLLEDHALESGLKKDPKEDFWDLKISLGEEIETVEERDILFLKDDYRIVFGPL